MNKVNFFGGAWNNSHPREFFARGLFWNDPFGAVAGAKWRSFRCRRKGLERGPL